jgi:hypothetical protein
MRIAEPMSRTHSRKKLTKQITAAAAILVVAVVGVIFLSLSHAASPYVSSEAESGTLSSGATKVATDPTASRNSFVQFGSVGTGTQFQYPAQVLNLTDWKISMPYDVNGNQFEPGGATPSTAVEIAQPQLAAFTDKYFYVNTTNDGAVFIAPVNGALTATTGYPRTELRQMASSSGTDEASWNIFDNKLNTEAVKEAVDHLPEVKPQIVVAQIHDSSHDIIEVLADATGTHSSDYAKEEPVDCSGAGGDINNSGCQFDICYRYDGTENNSDCLITDYTIGTKYLLTLSVQNSVITLLATYNGKTISIPITDTQSVDDSGDYFKAGCYTQSNYKTEGNYVDYGESTIYSISAVYNP